jgi:hypothetical protein
MKNGQVEKSKEILDAERKIPIEKPELTGT